MFLAECLVPPSVSLHADPQTSQVINRIQLTLHYSSQETLQRRMIPLGHY